MNKKQTARAAEERFKQEGITLADAIAVLRQALGAGASVQCPCCDKMAKIYQRHIYREQINQLFRLHAMGGYKKFCHITEFGKQGGDFAKLEWWGLIEEMPKDEAQKNKRTSGFWRITEKGGDFMAGFIPVPRFVREYNGKVLEYSQEKWFIKDAYGEGFNLQAMMAA